LQQKGNTNPHVICESGSCSPIIMAGKHFQSFKFYIICPSSRAASLPPGATRAEMISKFSNTSTPTDWRRRHWLVVARRMGCPFPSSARICRGSPRLTKDLSVQCQGKAQVSVLHYHSANQSMKPLQDGRVSFPATNMLHDFPITTLENMDIVPDCYSWWRIFKVNCLGFLSDAT